MIQDYNKTKENVLTIYGNFCNLIAKSKGDKNSTYDSSLEVLAEQVENIRKDRFLLMVVGEAKSGKSTFINAYLGIEILPMDVEQCTSAIIEIRYGEEFTLIATYADGTTDTYDDEQKIKNFLAVNAAVDDNYRAIPIAAINYEILLKYKNREIKEDVIDNFINGVKDDNLYHLPEEEYSRKIREYIKLKQPFWRKIVQKIEILYPFADTDLKDVEIIDTPGVNADGRIGYITDKHVERANAVMFLKPITGADLAASSFRRFLNSKSADRNKNAMFLVLTRAADEINENITRIQKSAIKQFPNISERQVIPIDSKVKLFYNKVKDMTIEEIEALIMEGIAAERLQPIITAPWFMAQRNRDIFLQKLMELSRFDVMNAALNQFSYKVQYIALNELLTRMLSVIDIAMDTLTEHVGFYKQKAVDPIELGNRMNKIEAEMEEMLKKINKTVEDIAIRYGETGGFIDEKVNEEVSSYRIEIEKISSSSSSSVDELEKISFRKIDMLTQFSNELQKRIVEECDNTLISLSDRSSIKLTTLKPNITRETFKKVKEEIRNSPDVQETYKYETGGCFKKSKTGTRFAQFLYFDEVKKYIEGIIEKLKNQMIYELKRFVTATTTAYSEELSRNANVKRKELNDISQEKQTAEETQAKIAELEELAVKLASLKDYIVSVKGGIEKHV